MSCVLYVKVKQTPFFFQILFSTLDPLSLISKQEESYANLCLYLDTYPTTRMKDKCLLS